MYNISDRVTGFNYVFYPSRIPVLKWLITVPSATI